MGKIQYTRLKGSQNLRLRLLLSTLSTTPIIIEDIRADASFPGLLPHEVSFLRLLEMVSDDCVVVINDTGTKVEYKPGIIVGGRHLVHDCGTSRAVGYFLEPLIVLGLFGKKPLSIRLKGITNDPKDPSVDTFRKTTLKMLERFGVPSEGLDLKIESRGVAPHGGGEVILSIPIVPESLKAVTWIDEGMVKRIRGDSFSTRVSVQFENTMIHAARGIFNRFLPDVHIFTDHKAGQQAGNSPGFGISLYAETTTGCITSTDTTVSHARAEDEGKLEDEKKELSPPGDVGENIASALLCEIEQGGVVGSTHQGLLFLLCALCPQDVSKVRVGKLSPYGIQVLRHIKDFLGVKFVIKPRPLSSAAASFSSTEALQVGSVQGHKELVTEVQFLGVVNHPNLVKFIGYCAMDGERGIQRLLVYEYMPNKSLDNHLMGPEVADYAREDSEVIYRDFKASNMLLDTEFNPKLLHFGLSREGPTAGHTHVSTTPQASVVFRKSMRWWEKSLHPNMVKIDSAQDFGGSFVECW